MRLPRLLPRAVLLTLGAAITTAWLCRVVPAAEPPPPAPSEVQFMNLILTAATEGQMLPCGRCRVKLGGLGRRAGFIQACRDTADFVLIADGGDLLLPTGPDPQVESFLIGMHAKLGYSVLGVGEEELERGARYLEELVAPHPGLEWVSANILDAATRKPIFAPYALRQAGRAVIGFTSVLGPELWQEHSSTQPGVTVEPALESLARLMPRLRSRCDLVVCFTHVGPRAMREIAQQIEGIGIVVASHAPSVTDFPTRSGFVKQVFSGGREGRYVNWSNIRLDANGIDPLYGRSCQLYEEVPEDSTVVREVLSFLGTSEPPGDGGAPGDPGAGASGEGEPAGGGSPDAPR